MKYTKIERGVVSAIEEHLIPYANIQSIKLEPVSLKEVRAEGTQTAQ